MGLCHTTPDEGCEHIHDALPCTKGHRLHVGVSKPVHVTAHSRENSTFSSFGHAKFIACSSPRQPRFLYTTQSSALGALFLLLDG